MRDTFLTEQAINRLAQSSDWKVFLSWIQDKMKAVSEQAMLSELNELEYSEVKGWYKAYSNVLRVQEIVEEEAELVRELHGGRTDQ